MLKSSEAVVHSCSTDYLFWKFREILQQKNLRQQNIYPITLFLYCNFPKTSKKLLLKAIKNYDGNGKHKRTEMKITLKQLVGAVLKNSCL